MNMLNMTLRFVKDPADMIVAVVDNIRQLELGRNEAWAMSRYAIHWTDPVELDAAGEPQRHVTEADWLDWETTEDKSALHWTRFGNVGKDGKAEVSKGFVFYEDIQEIKVYWIAFVSTEPPF
jgi:hypothetical protein